MYWEYWGFLDWANVWPQSGSLNCRWATWKVPHVNVRLHWLIAASRVKKITTTKKSVPKCHAALLSVAIMVRFSPQYLWWSLYKKNRPIIHAWRLLLQPRLSGGPVHRAQPQSNKDDENGEKNKRANWWELPLVTSRRMQQWFLCDRNLKMTSPAAR